MKCTNCKREVPQTHYCPHCGQHQPHQGKEPSAFDGLFSDSFFNQVLQNFEQMFEGMEGMDKEVLDLTKAGKKRKGVGFTVNIVQSGDGPPQIKIQPIGGEEAVLEPREQARPLPKKFSEAKRSEEPDSVVKRVGDTLVADLDLPGVKKEEDVAVTELDNSVEVRALAGDKTFFKIITKPAKLRLAAKKFKNGKLHLEFS